MYATVHRTEQWFSHHHVALAALIVLLAMVILGGARYVTLPRAAAPEAVVAPAHNAAAVAAIARYGNAKERQAEMQDRTLIPSVLAPSDSAAAAGVNGFVQAHASVPAYALLEPAAQSAASYIQQHAIVNAAPVMSAIAPEAAASGVDGYIGVHNAVPTRAAVEPAVQSVASYIQQHALMSAAAYEAAAQGVNSYVAAHSAIAEHAQFVAAETQSVADYLRAHAAMIVSAPTAQQRYQDMKERQAETQDRTTVPVPLSGPAVAQLRYQAMKETQAEMQDRTMAVAGPTAAQNAAYQYRMARLQDLNTSGDPELDAGLLPGALASSRSGPH
ncbi:MAG: hypothetical protein U0822_22615 [Anaerolineae bacterium]